MEISTKILKKEKIQNTQSYSLLIQGPINLNSLLVIDFYKEIFEDIVYSTYLDENSYLIKKFNHKNINFVFSNRYEEFAYNPSNIFYQSLTTLKGIESCKNDYVIKVRSDEFYLGIDKIINEIDDEKIIFSNIFFRHFSFYPYHSSDHIIAGKKSILKNCFSKIFDFCKEKKSEEFLKENFNICASPYQNLNQEYLLCMTPEQIISIFLLKSLENNVKIDLHNKEQNINLFHKYFKIIDVDKLRPYLISMRNETKRGRVYFDDYKKSIHYNNTDCNSIENYTILLPK